MLPKGKYSFSLILNHSAMNWKATLGQVAVVVAAVLVAGYVQQWMNRSAVSAPAAE